MYLTFLVAALVMLIDLISKHLVLQNIPLGARIVVVPRVLSLAHVRNAGAAFGLFPGQLTLFVGAAVVVILALFFFRADILAGGPWSVLASGMILGGAVGNLLDRVRFEGHVIDFISFSFFPPVFNIADSALVVGSLLLALTLVKAEM